MRKEKPLVRSLVGHHVGIKGALMKARGNDVTRHNAIGEREAPILQTNAHTTSLPLSPLSSIANEERAREARNRRSDSSGGNEAWPRLQHAVGQENHARPPALTHGVPQ
ncbi:uncharacterized protein LOC105427464 [Pogonomyrmex barbatus]|uniref:Uncharacterized protein LOC105427464 n=1 Tax=Pogonomyrmex barbatus TaxID=144034 RepID=A0A6I9WEF2_9HYME|nr:uncharacterized protein LOC105427464 [Pogonomyrmex barbatus]